MSKENRNSVRLENSNIIKDAFFVIKKESKENELLKFNIMDISHNGLRGKINKEDKVNYTASKIVEEGINLPIKVIFNNNNSLNISTHIAWANATDNFVEFGLYFVGSIW